MKKLGIVILMFCNSNLFGQFFNLTYGRLDPYLELINKRALCYQDSIWLFNLGITRYTVDNFIFFNSVVKINQYGVQKEELFLGDTTKFFGDNTWLLGKDSNLIILRKEYGADLKPYFNFITFDENLIKLKENTIKLYRDEANAIRMKQMSDGNIVFCGFIENYNKATKQYEEEQAILYKLDSLGNELWHVEYGDSLNSEKFYDFTMDNDGNIYAIGQWIEPYFDGNFQALLVKYDKNGKLLWSKLYGDENSLDYFTVINLNQNGDLVINGGWGHNTNKFFFDKYYGRMGYYIIDTSGVMQLSKEYQQYGSDMYDCVKDANDNLTCAGQTYEPDDKSTSGIIVKFNSVGDTLWTRYYHNYISGKRWTSRFYNIVSTHDSGYMVTGTKLYDFGFAPQLNQQGWVVKVDSLGYDHTTTWPVATQEPISTEQEPVIRFYPNPTSGDLFYRYRDVYMIERNAWVVSFYDLQGREVKTFEMSPFTNAIQLSSLADGVYPYIIRTKKHEFVISGKVVVDRR